jgi:serine/threonine protein kinase
VDRIRQEFEGTDRYVIQRRIGAGAFGVVYEAFDRERRLTVALKTLRHVSADALYRFKWEFRALADLAHPNLVSLYELLVEGERCFFTMELVRGVNFIDYVRSRTAITSPASAGDVSLHSLSPALVPDAPTQESGTGPHAWGSHERPREASDSDLSPPSPPEGPDVDRLRDALAQLTHGLCALHDAGKLHRDIKPSNVLVTGEGRVVLLDFGLVTEFGQQRLDAPADARVVGTPAYMSPEQAAGQAVSEGTDWYSIGVMLYEALTGRVPFSGDFVEMLNQKREREPPAPSVAVPGIPEDLDSLCRNLLWSDPTARVGGRDVLAHIGRTTADGVTPHVRATVGTHAQPFVGRQSHLALLRAAFADTKAGRAVTVYVHGESGMGKSALVRRFVEELARDEPDAVLLSGRCYEQESVPYKALDQLVDGLSQHLRRLPAAHADALLPRDVVALSRLFPVLRRVEALAGARRRVLEIPDPRELRRRAVVALRDLLSRLAERSPLVLFIDDLQWGDVDSASVLAELVRPPDPPALLLVGCYRSDDATRSPLLRALLGLRGTPEWGADVRELVVGELEPAEARALVQALVDTEHRQLAREADVIGRESGGNPFFIDEIVRYFQASAGRGDVRTIGLDTVVRARLSPLSAPAARLLNVVALAGRPVAFDIAGQAADLSPEDYSALGALRAGRLIRTRSIQQEEELEAYHDRIREAVVSQLSAEARSTLHGRLAQAMEVTGRGDPETLALHFQRGGNTERAAHYATAAATHASEALAFDRAARLYRLALELRPPGQADDRDLRIRLAAALANAGRGAEAAQHYFRASAGAPPADFVDLQRRAAEQLLISGHLDEGLRALRTALEPIRLRLAATPRRALASWLARRVYVRLRGLGFRERAARDVSPEKLLRIDSCWSVAMGLAYVDTFRAADFQARHLLLALKAGEPYRIARALALEGGYSSTAGWRSAARTAQIFDATMALAERLDHPHALGLATISAGVAASLEGRWRQALELCERADVILRERCTGVAWELDTVDLTSLVSLIYLGRLNDVAQRLPALLMDAHERGDLYKSAFLRTRISYACHLAADEPARAREEVRKRIEGWPHQAFQLEHYWTLLSEAEIAMYEGGTLAWRLLQTGWPAFARTLLPRIQYSLIEALDRRARSALSAAADVPAADRAAFIRGAERDARRIERERTPWGDALALLVRAGVAVARGRVDAATTLLTTAEQSLQALDMALHAASARRHRGHLIGGEEGRRLILDADTWMTAQRIRNPARMAALLSPGSPVDH